jgi:hypothetical protein
LKKFWALKRLVVVLELDSFRDVFSGEDSYSKPLQGPVISVGLAARLR